MKKKYLIYLVLLGIICFVIGNIALTGDSHIVVVKENGVLTEQNGQLKKENGHLKNENKRLSSENKLLNEKVSTLTTKKAIKEDIKPEKKEEKVELIIKNKIEQEYGWATPEYVYDVLQEKIKRKPSKKQYRMSLLEVLNSDALFYPLKEYPESKGERVLLKDIDSLVMVKKLK